MSFVVPSGAAIQLLLLVTTYCWPWRVVAFQAPFKLPSNALVPSYGSLLLHKAAPVASKTSELSDVAKDLGIQDVLTAKPFALPELPWPLEALEPVIDLETMQYHYGKHHAAYVRNLNALVQKDPFLQGKSLEDVVQLSQGATFNNAAQTWNHNFFWQCMKPVEVDKPYGPLLEAINDAFGSYDGFKEAFLRMATAHFGSGWVWLTHQVDGKLLIEATSDANNPIRTGSGIPIMGLDLWEHAYYLKYRNNRAKYVSEWFKLINWEFANHRFGSHTASL